MVLRFVGQVVPNAFYAFLETIFALFDLLFSLLGFLTDFFFQLAGAFVDIVDAVFIPVRVLLGMVLDFAYALLEVSDLIPFCCLTSCLASRAACLISFFVSLTVRSNSSIRSLSRSS